MRNHRQIEKERQREDKTQENQESKKDRKRERANIEHRQEIKERERETNGSEIKIELIRQTESKQHKERAIYMRERESTRERKMIKQSTTKRYRDIAKQRD